MMTAALAAGGKPVAELPLEEARRAYSLRYAQRSLPGPEGVQRRELRIPTQEGDLAARMYRPDGLAGELALLVYFHGGGFVLGDAAGYEGQSARLAKEIGCVLLFPEYRLAPEYPYPAAWHDAVATLNWAREHAVELGVDPDRIVVAGDSVGGNLAANMAVAARDGLAPPLALQALFYPVVDYRRHFGLAPATVSSEEFARGYWLDRGAQEWFARCYLRRPEDASEPRASILLVNDLRGLAPALVVTAAFDPLRDEGRAYAERLKDAGVVVADWCIDGMIHNFLGHTAKSAAARAAFARATSEIRRRCARRISDAVSSGERP